MAAKKILLVIDMQNYFPASLKESTIQACRKLIRQFVKDKGIIIFVEYYPYGPTLHRLKKLIPEKYRPFYVVKKTINNGTRKIDGFIKRKGYKGKDVTACGVNSDCCVKETCYGLAKRGYNVTVVKKACNRNSSNATFPKYPKSANLVLK